MTPEQRREYNQKWWVANPAKRRRYKRADYRKHKKKRLATSRRWRLANPDKVRAYKMSRLPQPTRPRPEKCECCGHLPLFGRWKVLALDHDHITGKFRGWLCGRCNIGIGALGDIIKGALLAVNYLQGKVYGSAK